MLVKPKAFAYITKGQQLLVFTHRDFPEAGLQVPAGTIKPTESADEAALREAQEETGLLNLKLVSFLGCQERDMSDYGKAEIHRRYFYHLEYTGETPLRWSHAETDPSDRTSDPIWLELFWADLQDDLPPLIADQDYFLAVLTKNMALY